MIKIALDVLDFEIVRAWNKILVTIQLFKLNGYSPQRSEGSKAQSFTKK